MGIEDDLDIILGRRVFFLFHGPICDALAVAFEILLLDGAFFFFWVTCLKFPEGREISNGKKAVMKKEGE